MNVKEIAVVAGRQERAVHNWVKKASAKNAQIYAKIAQARSASIPADYTIDETCAIIEVGLGKNAAGIFRTNTMMPTVSPDKLTSLTTKDIDVISTMVGRIVALGTDAVNDRLSRLEKAMGQNQIYLQVPEIRPREAINRLVREYAHIKRISFSAAWEKLYSDFNYTYKRNVNLSAKHREMSILDYIEVEGLIDQLYAVAKRTCA